MAFQAGIYWQKNGVFHQVVVHRHAWTVLHGFSLVLIEHGFLAFVDCFPPVRKPGRKHLKLDSNPTARHKAVCWSLGEWVM